MKGPSLHLASSHLKYLYVTSVLNISVILFLFLFFVPMFSSPSGLSVLLPKALTPETFRKPCFVVTILADGDLYLDSKKISAPALRQFFNSKRCGQYQVLVKADRRSRIEALVRVWDDLRQAGASVVHMATNE